MAILDVSFMDKKFKSSLDYSLEINNADVKHLFDNRAEISYKHGHTCCSDTVGDGLQRAAETGNLKMVKAFLNCPNIDLNDGYRYGQTPLFIASLNNNQEVVIVLLNDSRTDVNVIVNSRNTLLAASELGFTNIVRVLLSHSDIDVNIINTRNRRTALIVATDKQHLDIIRLLLLNPQTYVNEVDGKGLSSIMIAAMNGYTRILKLLLRCPKTHIFEPLGEIYKTDIKQTLLRKTILEQMKATCCLDAKVLLLAKALEGDFKAVRGLLHCPHTKENVNGVDLRGRTPIYLASMSGHLQVVVVLLNYNETDVNVGVPINGGTPFSVASERSHFDLMGILIRHENIDVGQGWCTDSWATYKYICYATRVSVPTSTMDQVTVPEPGDFSYNTIEIT